MDGFATDAMRRGIALEPAAIAAYEAATGRLVQATGFLADEDAMLGCSLDGHVGDFEGIVEVKCRAAWAHLDALSGGPVPARDVAQVTHNLLVSGAAWCDVVSVPMIASGPRCGSRSPACIAPSSRSRYTPPRRGHFSRRSRATSRAARWRHEPFCRRTIVRQNRKLLGPDQIH